MNTRSKHTQGPWNVRREVAERGCPLEIDACKCVVAKVYDHHEGIANAYLIAAAPAMYDALQNILEFYEWSNSNGAEQAAYDKAMKALAQAEGRTL